MYHTSNPTVITYPVAQDPFIYPTQKDRSTVPILPPITRTTTINEYDEQPPNYNEFMNQAAITTIAGDSSQLPVLPAAIGLDRIYSRQHQNMDKF